METVLALLRRSRWKLAGAVIAGAISGLGLAALIALINTALSSPRDELAPLVPAFVALCGVVFVARTVSEGMLVRLSQRLIAALRSELARQVLASPLRHLEQQGPHRLLAALTEDVQKIASLLTRLPTFCINSAVALGCFAYLGWLSWPLMLIGLLGLGLAVGGFCLAQRRAQAALEQSREASDELYKHFLAVTHGSKELQLHGGRRKAFLTEWLDTAVARVRRHFVSGMTVYALAESVGILVFFVLIGLMLFVPKAMAMADTTVLTGFALTLLYLITPIEVLVNLAPDFGQFRVALKNLGALQLSLGKTDAMAETAHVHWGNVRQLHLRGVTHSYRSDYDDTHFVLGPIDLDLRCGQMVFITGGNGSGKTTLAKLLVGLYEPEAGGMEVNGHAVATAERDAYRQLFSAVFSDFYLFEGLLGVPDEQLDTKARQLLASLRLEHKVSLKPDGRFSTVALSQGQRKRLALLAAVLEDRPVYLFDEWAADQDPVFKRVFYTEVLPWLKAQGKLVIAITHDDAYFHLADQHIRLDSGRITSVCDATPPHRPVAPTCTPGEMPHLIREYVE